VKNTIPRGEFLLKKFAGKRFGAEKASGTPSQLISRWPVADGGPAMLLGFPKKFLKASTAVWISAGVAPEASNTCGAAEAATGLNMSVKPKVAIASQRQCLFMIFMDCIVLVDVEVLFLFWFFRLAFFEPSYLLKRKSRLKPATTAEFFSNRLAPYCINSMTVLEFVASSSRYDDALIHAARGDPTAG
jgi:hypothetical protein